MDIGTLTFLLIAATSIVSVVSFSNARLYSTLLFSVDAVLRSGQSWRLFTSGFVHADWAHLLFNMIALWSFGSLMEHVMGLWRFALLYCLGIVVASFTSLVVHRNQPDYRAVGASGGVCAVIGGATALFPDLGIYVFFIPIAVPAWIVGSAFVVYTIVGAGRQADNIGHIAHLGGTLYGIGFVIAFYPMVMADQWQYVAAILVAGIGAWLFMRSRSGL